MINIRKIGYVLSVYHTGKHAKMIKQGKYVHFHGFKAVQAYF